MRFRIAAIPASGLVIAGHVGLWAGLYVTGAYVFFWQISAAGSPGSWPRVAAVVSVLLAATAVYAVDRVKLSDVRIDPADRLAHPHRYGFLSRYSSIVRSIVVVMIVLSMTLAYEASIYMPLLVAAAIVGVVFYAPGPRGKRPRPKDVLGLKNAIVAIAVVMLALASTFLVGPLSDVHGDAFWKLAPSRVHAIIPAAILLLVRVMIDAAICDIEDRDADAKHGTHTLATAIGEARTLYLTVAGRVVLSALIVMFSIAPMPVRMTWSISNAIGAMLLLAIGRRMKDWVDVSFAIEAVLVTIVIAMIV